ncbi:unnamed protein product [Microthlaspi erraticum]|uniref:Zinc knuckle CX2CX4HX4C domain-containing protein n=1 Tax=Microthlaspi erraticum TaxID=1685480 RepID=A0A6D2LH04_9BRAS|nr:unnamed protein product [Microthlaspi erraticum]
MQVPINADQSLQFERRVGFPNGDTGKVTFTYEGLFRHYYTCKRISHEERSCPELNEAQRELKRAQRAVPELIAPQNQGRHNYAARKANEFPERSLSPPHYKRKYSPNGTRMETNENRTRNHSAGHITRENWRTAQNDKLTRNMRDLRKDLQDKREYRGREVWKRLDAAQDRTIPRPRERYHPYSRNQYETCLSNLKAPTTRQVWRPKSPRNDRRNVYEETPQTRNSVQAERSHTSHVDSQRTISVQETNPMQRRGKLVVYQGETEQDRLRRIKGKGILVEAPKKTKQQMFQMAMQNNMNATFAIRDPQEQVRIPAQTLPDRPKQTSAQNTNQRSSPPKEKTDMSLSPRESPEKEMTEGEKMALDLEMEELFQEAEAGLMDDEMMENDDLLGEEMDEDAEKVDAISQLSPEHPSHGGNQKNANRPEPHRVGTKSKGESNKPQNVPNKEGAQQDLRSKSGKQPPKVNDHKGFKASKKLNALRAKPSQKKKP